MRVTDSAALSDGFHEGFGCFDRMVSLVEGNAERKERVAAPLPIVFCKVSKCFTSKDYSGIEVTLKAHNMTSVDGHTSSYILRPGIFLLRRQLAGVQRRP